MGTVNQEEQLKRIADALERIGNGLKNIDVSLEDISSRIAESCDRLQGIEETLSSCVSTYGNNSFLCITGNVSTN